MIKLKNGSDNPICINKDRLIPTLANKGEKGRIGMLNNARNKKNVILKKNAENKKKTKNIDYIILIIL